jgi:hypothetical protein
MQNPFQPPEWMANPPLFRKVRWGVVAAQTELDVTVNALLYAQCTALSTTTVSTWAQAVRLRRIRIWFVSPTLGTTVTSTIEWNAGATGFLVRGTSVSQTNGSTTELACLDCRPPTDSLSGWYQGGSTAGTNVIFSFSAPAGAILQLDFDWVPLVTEAGLGTLSSVGTVAGTNYCRGISSNILAFAPLNSAPP